MKQEIGQVDINRKHLRFTDDDAWQDYFSLLKLSVTPSKNKNMHRPKPCRCYIGEYKGETNVEAYVRYINDVLKQIRAGYPDYCYFVHQIADLLKFEHDNLRTRYIPDGDFVAVWLEK